MNYLLCNFTTGRTLFNKNPSYREDLMRMIGSRRGGRSGAGRGRSGAGENTLVGAALVFTAVGTLLGGCRSAGTSPGEPTQARSRSPSLEALKPGDEVSLFDGRTLGQWKVTDFGGQGDVYVKDGAIYLEMGDYMTGITWTGPVVRMGYEITLEAMRVEGSDFFCGLTFPVADKPCTLVLGGWGGSVCGLSNIDHYDAAENETTRVVTFLSGRWYRVRLRVVPNRIQAWLDDESLVDIDTTGRRIDIRLEVDLSQPLGIATYSTTGAIRNIRLRKLSNEEMLEASGDGVSRDSAY
jgi:hypothetical protein